MVAAGLVVVDRTFRQVVADNHNCIDDRKAAAVVVAGHLCKFLVDSKGPGMDSIILVDAADTVCNIRLGMVRMWGALVVHKYWDPVADNGMVEAVLAPDRNLYNCENV